MDYFFTLPSQLGRRISAVDPLGFRGAATNYLLRAAPGFSGRVKGRAWIPMLAWAAAQVEDQQRTLSWKGAEEDGEASQVRQRSDWLATFERAIRLAAVMSGREKASQQNGTHRRWRYGNSQAWWKNTRKESFDYLEQPLFFPGVRGERGSNALACLRRTLERFSIFVPSENRLNSDTTSRSRLDRFRLTPLGRDLADAFARDLDARGVDLSHARKWALFVRPKDRDYKSETKRKAGIGKLDGLIPLTKADVFAEDGFPRTLGILNQLLATPIDRLMGESAGRGAIGSCVDSLLGPDRLPVEEALGSGTRAGPWDERLRLAHRPLWLLMTGNDEVVPLFVTLGRAFVDTMTGAFPPGEISCPDFPSASRKAIAAEDLSAFESGRSAYLRARDALRACEDELPMGLCPAAERGTTRGVRHFDRWLERTSALTPDSLVALHVEQPRFRGGRVVPLIDMDPPGAYLESEFPWGDVDLPRRREESEEFEGTEPEVDEDGEEEPAELGEDEDEERDYELGRGLQTDYWYAARAAARVIRGGGA